MEISVFTDGGARGNPGPAGYGLVILDENKNLIFQDSKYLGIKTNNEAEYQAVIFALKKFKALFGKKLAEHTEIEIRSDSEFLVLQVNGEYKILDEKIQKLFLELWNLRLDFKKTKFKYISREKNKEADRLVNEALDNIGKSRTLI